MVSIMRVYKSAYKLKHFLLLFFLSFSELSSANDNWLFVKSISLGDKLESRGQFQAQLEFTLSPVAYEALHSGIILYWDVSVIASQGYFLISKPIFTDFKRFSLRYNTLFNEYRVTSESKKNYRRFSSLADALDYLSHIKYDSIFLEGSHTPKCINVDLVVSFDREALPIPLRPISYFDEGWNLSTNVRLECE